MRDEQPGLFDKAESMKQGMAARERAASRHAQEIALLVPLAKALAAKAPEISVSDLRLYAVQRGILSGDERGRQLSYLGKVMEAAGLERTGRYVRSSVVRSHGNLNAIWCLPEQREGAA